MARPHTVTNIVGQTSKYDLAKVSQSYTLNMFEETVDANESYVQKVLRPIPGYKTITTTIHGNCRGMFTVPNGYKGKPATYAVFDDTLYLIMNDKWPLAVGQLTPGSSPVHFAVTGNREGFSSHLVIVDGNACYAVPTQVLPAVQTASFKIIQLPYRTAERLQTIQPTHVAYLYGYIVVNDSGTDNFYISYQFPFERKTEGDVVDDNIFQVGSEEWGYTGQYQQSYWQPDNTNALVANGSRLFTFGEKSYQLFQYTNDLNVPFNSPDTAAKNIGLKAIDSLCQIADIMLWLGSSDIGNNGIYLNKGGVESERVSTPAIERQLAKLKTVKDARAQIWQDNQHIFYVINFPSGNLTLCYDITEQSWTNRCSIDDKNNQKSWRYEFATMNSDGKIWQACKEGIVEQTEDNWTEHDGNPILRLRRGGVIYSNYQNFIINNIELSTNNGQYNKFYEDSVKMMMRFSTDGSTWSDEEVVDIGHTGDYDYDTIFYNFGLAKVFTIEFSCSENVPFALYNIKINADECSF